MTLDRLTHRFAEQAAFRELRTALQNAEPQRIVLRKLAGSSRAVLAAALVQQQKGVHLFVLNDKDAAAYFYHDLYQLSEGGEEVLFFPSGYKNSSVQGGTDPSGEVQRTAVLAAIDKHVGDGRLCIVSYPEAVCETVVSAETLQKNTLRLHVGESIGIDFILDLLIEFGFERVDFVYEPGQFAIRGSIVDIFSYSDNKPYRVDFFGNEVETLRTFDLNTQLSDKKLEQIEIVPQLQQLPEGERTSLLVLLKELSPLVWLDGMELVLEAIRKHQSEGEEGGEGDRMVDAAAFKKQVQRFSCLHFENCAKSTAAVEFNCEPQPAFNKNFELLAAHVKALEEEGYSQVILSEHLVQVERLQSVISNINEEQKELDYALLGLHEGFVDKCTKTCYYTDHQIFARFHKFKLHGELKKSEQLTLQELNALQVGDYVVHIDHGVGVFGGLVKQMIHGKPHEYIKLTYRDDDVLMVSVHGLHRISRYKSKDGAPPKVYKLGNGVWTRLKQNAKSKVKDIARDLIALYAKRKETKGFAFSADSYMQHELEASFMFDDTPDQAKTTLAVKADMEESNPMDRLVCGDVGFGKTEIAIRAAFKAVADSKQVCVLVPTTILALQHYKTFSRRLRKFPCTVEYLSRFKTSAEIKLILEKLAKGTIDMIIGTHKLLGSQVKFKDLGLLIIDEEQKFGVGAKEKLRAMRLNVDTLTLTATPIPRTLQFSLMGARDLSIIQTPPPNRQAVVTEVHEFDEEVVRAAINKELERGGQVFLIHNRVQDIHLMEELVRRLCPYANVAVAHGQMEGNEMEKRVVDFINGEFDVLIATNIVENGIDIPNANTMIVHQAQNFGLGDLHQLRGRVGRSNVKAYCYLLTAPAIVLTREAQQRLKAIEQFSDLGSGFNIAMQDLDIRGAGNLLGGEQSGFITEIGFETYQKILNEAIIELRQEGKWDGPEATSDPEQPTTNAFGTTQGNAYVADCSIETDMELLLPDSYVSNTAEKIKLYREMDELQTEDSIARFCEQLTDRFGAIPTQTLELLNVVRLRQGGIRAGFEKIILKNDLMVAYFVSPATSAYYETALFAKIMQNINHHPQRLRMKEHNNRLSLVAQDVSSVAEAMKVLIIVNG